MNNPTLSSNDREKMLQHISRSSSNNPLDLLIIGGGITGAGIALDAASRGLRVALMEKQDFSAGTSSRSTKLIHGGLRYLKQGEFKLVREVGRERELVYRNAPHLVSPERMLLPLVHEGSLGRLSTSCGLWLYDLLAGVRKEERRVMLSKKEALQVEPLLPEDRLKGAGLYYEYRTDDARLTLSVIKTAVAHGAWCVNYAEATQFLYQDDQVVGMEVRNRLSQETHRLYARTVINATGPWVDLLRKKDRSLEGKRLFLTKGVHLVVPYHRLPLKQSSYFDTPDRRMIFAIPHQQVVYIGTTDTPYTDELEHPSVTREDTAYLLQAVHAMFPKAKLTSKDILSSWAGIRPLLYQEGKSPSQLSRKDEIIISPTGLITIAGGKLTGYRRMAEKVVDVAVKRLRLFYQQQHKRISPCQTERLVLSGGNFGPSSLPSSSSLLKGRVEQWTAQLCQQAKQELGLPHESIRSLVQRYGTEAEKIVAQASLFRLPHTTIQKRPIPSTQLRLLLAELEYGIQHEMVTNAEDFTIRRTGRYYFERQTLDWMSPLLEEYLAHYRSYL